MRLPKIVTRPFLCQLHGVRNAPVMPVDCSFCAGTERRYGLGSGADFWYPQYEVTGPKP